MRTLNRLLAPVAALALLAWAVLLSIEVAAAGFGVHPVFIHWHGVYQDGRHNIWRSTGPILISAILAAIGIFLLAIQLTPRRVTDRQLTTDAADVDAVLSSAGLRTTLGGAAKSVDGVATVKVSLRRRSATVRATTHGSTRGQADRIREQVAEATNRRLTDIGLSHPPRLKVNVVPGKPAQ